MRIPLQPSVLALMSFSRSAPMECPCPGGWLKIWSVGFTYCTVTHRSPADNDTDLWITVTALGPLLSGHLASYEYVTGSLQAFFKISLLELFGTSVLNRDSWLRAIYIPALKNFTSTFLWQAGAFTKTWTWSRREGEAWWSLVPFTLPFVLNWQGTEQTPSHLVASWGPGTGRRRKAALQPFPCLLLRILSFHSISWLRSLPMWLQGG